MVVMSNNVVLLKLQLFTVGYMSEDLEEKKLLGSGGYAFAKLTEQEEIKASLGVPQIFLGNVGRLNEDRFSKYYCKRCEKEYPGCPVIRYENPNEELGEGIILIEKGEYRCRTCNNLIALYRNSINKYKIIISHIVIVSFVWYLDHYYAFSDQ